MFYNLLYCEIPRCLYEFKVSTRYEQLRGMNIRAFECLNLNYSTNKLLFLFDFIIL